MDSNHSIAKEYTISGIKGINCQLFNYSKLDKNKHHPTNHQSPITMLERVLVVGATGNIGVAAVKGALRSGREVIAIVRNQASADKLYKHIGSSEGITVVEASVISDTGIKSLVDQVKAGKLPAFQHVYTCGWSFILYTQI